MNGALTVPSPCEGAAPDNPKESESIRFRIPGLPPSINSIYQIIYAQRRVELKPEVRLYKSRAKQYVPRWVVAPMQPLKMELKFYAQWFFKNSAFRKLDLQNLIKVVVDAVAEKQGWCDSQVWEFEASKIQSDEEYIAVTLTKL